jgi:WD40 repeat protein
MGITPVKAVAAIFLSSLVMGFGAACGRPASPPADAAPTLGGPASSPPLLEEMQVPLSSSDWKITSLAPITPANLPELAELHTLQGGDGGIIFIEFSPDGSLLAASGTDQTIRLWNTASGDEIAAVNVGAETFGLAFNQDGDTLASADADGRLRLWDLATMAEIKAIEGHQWGLLDVEFDPAGVLIASAGVDESVRLWDPSRSVEEHVLHGHQGRVNNLGFSPDGRMLASGSEDGSICIWDTASGELIDTLIEHEEQVLYIEFSPDGSMFASCGGGITDKDHAIRIWNTSSWEVTRTLNGHDGTVAVCSFNHDGTLLFSRGNDRAFNIWDPSTGDLLRTTIAGGGFWRVAPLAHSRDGKFLATADGEGMIHIYGIP